MTVVVHQRVRIKCSMCSLYGTIVRPHYGVIADICFATVASSYRHCEGDEETKVIYNQCVRNCLRTYIHQCKKPVWYSKAARE